MADLSPLGSIVSFGGTAIVAASVGYPSISEERQDAYEYLIGSPLPVDLYNQADQPAKRVLTCMVLIRADDSVTDSAAAWTAVATGYRALRSLPQVGTLVAHKDAGSSATVSCQARLGPIPLDLKPSNARSISVPLSFTLLTQFS